MSITFYGAMGLGQISLDHPSGVDWINQRNTDMRIISDLVAVYPFTSMAIPYADATGKLTQAISELQWDTTNKIMRVGTTAVAVNTISHTMPGLSLSVGSMGIASKYGFGLKFVSTDAQFTTTSPKFLAGILPRSTENYDFDTSGGMALDFVTSPDTPGASAVPVVRMTLEQTGNLTFTNNASILSTDTADGADTKGLHLCGGGTNSGTRGAVIQLYGNENANTGNLALNAGNVAGGTIILTAGGSPRMTVAFDGGVTIGSPTGGSKGAGTLNAIGVYDDNVLLSDAIFEPDYPLLPLAEMQAFFEKHKHLPTIKGREAWEREGKFSVGQLATMLWETVEVQARYLADLHGRIAVLEARG